MVMVVYCSSRGPEFIPRACQLAHNHLLAPTPGDWVPSSGLCRYCSHVHKATQRPHTYTQLKINLFKKWLTINGFLLQVKSPQLHKSFILDFILCISGYFPDSLFVANFSSSEQTFPGIKSSKRETIMRHALIEYFLVERAVAHSVLQNAGV